MSRAEHPAVESAAPSWWRSLRWRSSCSSAPVCSSEAGGVNNIDPGFRPERVLVMELSPDDLQRPAQRTDLPPRARTDSGGSGCGERRHHRRSVHWNPREQVLTVERDDGTVSERLRFARRGQRGFLQTSERRCSAAASFRSGIGPMLRRSRSSTMRWLGARGRGTIQWAEGSSWPAGFRPPVVHSRGRGGRHAAAGAGARSAPADVRVARAESSPGAWTFHTNLVGRPAGDGRGTSSGRASRGEECADLWGGASGTAARNLRSSASRPRS